ncbi:MAG: phosphoethanolamine transferase, partial [Muribaculaceae bacterium]|nr:phosphoethanolamine transferase [Muribaculaceae bacterium]
MLKKLTDILTSFPHVRLWYLILFILSVACLIDVPGAPVFGMSKFTQIVFTVSVSAFKASLLIIFAAWLWRYRKARILLIILLVLYIIVAITNVGAFAFYGFGMSRKLISLIAQTNPSEASEFIPDIISHLGLLFSSLWTWIAVIIAILTGVLFCKLPRMGVILITGALSLTGLGMYTWLFLSFDTAKTSIAMSLRIPKYFMDQRRWNLEMQQRIDNKKPLPHPESVKSKHAAANVVVIIGESSNRPNLSLYGFPLQTSPYMDSMADSLIVFTDAIASSLLTSANVERIISFKADDLVEGDWYNYPSLIDLFKAAGYKTYWLSNQERAGVWSNAVGALASGVDVMSFVGMEYCDDTLLAERTFDDVLLQPFKKALSDAADYRMIFLHLLGSHTIYHKRFPPERARYSVKDIYSAPLNRPWLNDDGAQLLADYSNSLVFTDSIWHETFREIADNPSPSILIYLSDHGEKVCEGDNLRGRDSHSVEIPFIIYANKAYREANPGIMEQLAAAK